jgi:nicotinate-nucleotide adenylyltransferase
LNPRSASSPRRVAGVHAVQGGRRRIGLLGGSFNPAHGGHRHISLLAFKYLNLNEIWWLVSPQNPLKPTAGMAPFAARVAGARRVVAGHPRIKVSDLEARFGTHYTADTLAALKRRFPRLRFVWLMGADNLAQIVDWQDWPKIFTELSIAVFDRPTYSFRALAGKAARRYRRFRVRQSLAKRIAELGPPAWVFLHIRLHKASATAIRARRRAVATRTRKGDRNHSTTQSEVAHSD